MAYIEFDMSLVTKKLFLIKSLSVNAGKLQFLSSVKSFPNEYFQGVLMSNHVGFDIANKHELLFVINLIEKYEPSHTVFISITGVDFQSIGSLLSKIPCHYLEHLDVQVNFDSLSQYERYRNDMPEWVKFGVRLAWPEKDHHRSRFGIPFDDCNAIKVISSDCRFVGFHAHSAERNKDEIYYFQFLSKLSDLISNMSINVERINLGGGICLNHISEIERIVKEVKNALGRHVMVQFEPGAFWSEDAGFLHTKVLDIKVCSQTNDYIAVLDVSASCHLKWCSPSALLISKRICHSVRRVKKRIYFFGSTCYENDLVNCSELELHEDEKLPVSVGQTLVFNKVSGYSYSWNTAFNGLEKLDVKFTNAFHHAFLDGVEPYLCAPYLVTPD